MHPYVGCGGAQILTQFIGVAAEHVAQNEYLADAFREFVDALLNSDEETILDMRIFADLRLAFPDPWAVFRGRDDAPFQS